MDNHEILIIIVALCLVQRPDHARYFKRYLMLKITTLVAFFYVVMQIIPKRNLYGWTLLASIVYSHKDAQRHHYYSSWAARAEIAK